MTNKGLHKMKMRKASPEPWRLMEQILKKWRGVCFKNDKLQTVREI